MGRPKHQEQREQQETAEEDERRAAEAVGLLVEAQSAHALRTAVDAAQPLGDRFPVVADALAAAVGRLRRNLGLGPAPKDPSNEVKHVVHRGAREATLPTMRAILGRYGELCDAVEAAEDRRSRWALRRIRNDYAATWGLPSHVDGTWHGRDHYKFATVAYTKLCSNLSLAAKLNARFDKLDERGACGL